nr:uncharacterized protein LOC119169286 isoform X2 [Rhipicephalus microplus]
MNFNNACYQLGVLNRLTGCAKLHLCVMAAATPRKRRGPKYCCVVGCYNTADNIRARGLPIKLYRFPGKSYEKERRETWITAVRRINPDGTPWLPKDHTRICSTHFQGNRKSDIREHPAYIPTIFPSVYRQKARDQQKAQRLQSQMKIGNKAGFHGFQYIRRGRAAARTVWCDIAILLPHFELTASAKDTAMVGYQGKANCAWPWPSCSFG